MIGSVRGKLTAFNTAVTAVILLAMTLLCLFVSEQDTRQQTLQNFHNYLNTLTSYLTSQDTMSSQWLRQVEGTGNVAISISDNGKPLFSLRHGQGELSGQFQQVRSRAEVDYDLYADKSCAGKSCSFVMEGENGTDYIGGLAVVSKENSVMELMLLFPLEEMQQGIVRQRTVVFLGVTLALGVLWLFSWYFTGRMLQPIRESRQRQIEFTAAASHELRTPLAAILSAASAMDQAEGAQRSYFLQQIQGEGQRMSRLIGDLLTLSGGDSQNWEIHRAPADPDMVLLEIYERYLPLAKKTGLALEICVPQEQIPEVSMDRERICQVLNILMDNALAYTPAPGQVLLGLEAGKRHLRFFVSDSGAGVPEGERKEIFQRFHRGQKERSDRSHFGLGLSIAAQIVEHHGGKLWVQDGRLGGAEFVLELPQ